MKIIYLKITQNRALTNTSKRLLVFLILLFSMNSVMAQASSVATSPPLTGGNGQSGISFNITAHNADIIVDSIHGAFYGTANNVVEVWYIPSPINGAPTISTANGWFQAGTGNLFPIQTGFTNTSIQSIPFPINVEIPQGQTYGFFVSYSNVAYTSYTTGQSAFTDGEITIETGTNVGYGGPMPSPTFHPRQFNGEVFYSFAAKSPIDAGIQEVLSPVHQECGNISHDVTVLLRNFGTEPIVNVPVTVEITGSLTTTLTATYSDTIHPLQAVNYVLGTINTNPGGIYHINTYTSLPGDTVNANDTLTQSMEIYGVPSTPTTISPVSACKDEPKVLTVSGDASHYRWFTESSGGTSVFTGSSYNTVFQHDTTLYVEGYNAEHCPGPRIPVNITVSELYVDQGKDTIVCFGDQVSIGGNPTATGNSPPYTYSWTPAHALDQGNIANPVFTADTNTKFTLLVSNSMGCELERVLEIEVSPELTMTSDIVDEKCVGENNGSLTISVSGGIPPFSYLWNNNSAFPFIWGASPGNYSVVVTDQIGCEINGAFTVNAAEPILVTETITHASGPGVSNGSISIDVSGGVPPYTFLWSNGQTTQNAGNLVPGTYSVDIKDGNDCMHSETFTVEVGTGISETGLIGNIKVYPTPANNYLIIEAEVAVNAGIILEIFDLTGRRVYSSGQPVTGVFKEQMPVSQWAEGNYILRISIGNEFYHKKLMISR